MKIGKRMADGGWRIAIARGAGSSFALSLALLMPGTAPAQVANDPTRPPSGLGTAEAEPAEEAGAGMTLQSVMISPTHKAAIISGVMVKLGEKYGDAVLVKVAENEVVLKSGSESQVLKLYPGVDKREVAPVPAKGTPRRARPQATSGPGATGSAPQR